MNEEWLRDSNWMVGNHLQAQDLNIIAYNLALVEE